jgi:hypothetical protein
VRTAIMEIGGGRAPAEIWYPAERGSEVGKSDEVYDFLKWLPPDAQEEVPAVEKPVPVICHGCYRDLPIDAAYGPYPIALYVHNVGAFRTAAVNMMAHWASRGFVVVALDYPRLHLQDVLAYATLGSCTPSGITEDTTRKREITGLLEILRAPAGDFAFLTGVADATKVAVVGHGDGSDYAARASGQAGVRLIVQINNSFDVRPAGDLAGVAYITGLSDASSVGRPSAAESAFLNADVPAIYAAATSAGALSATELCNAKNSRGNDGMDISEAADLCGANYAILRIAWDCKSTYLDQPTANARFGFATVSALEQYLKGKDRSAAWQKFDADWGVARVSTD